MIRRVAVPPRSLVRRVGGHVSTAGGVINALTNAQNIGANCLQIFAGSPRSWARKLYPIEEAKNFVTQSERLDLQPTFIHALYLVNLASDNPDLLKKSVDSLIFDLQNGDLINSAGVIVHIGSHQGRGFSIVADQVAGVIREIINASTKTPFVIENSAGQQGKIGLLSEISQLFKTINHPRLKLCLDTAHLFEAGYDLNDLTIIDDLVGELGQLDLLDQIVCLHLNDSKTDLNSRHDQHANLGDGQIGLLGLSQFVNHPAFVDLPLILEVPGDKGMVDATQISRAHALLSN